MSKHQRALAARRSAHQRGATTATPRLTRRAWIGAATGAVLFGTFGWRRWFAGTTASVLGAVTVYKSPTCQCCERWGKRMREHGFTIKEENRADVTPVKREHGVPDKLVSCHTSLIEGYVFEGHVPPDLVQQVLRDRPSFAGLAVPGMPQGAPGMETRREPYEVISFTRAGETAVYAVRS